MLTFGFCTLPLRGLSTVLAKVMSTALSTILFVGSSTSTEIVIFPSKFILSACGTTSMV